MKCNSANVECRLKKLSGHSEEVICGSVSRTVDVQFVATSHLLEKITYF